MLKMRLQLKDKSQLQTYSVSNEIAESKLLNGCGKRQWRYVNELLIYEHGLQGQFCQLKINTTTSKAEKHAVV